MTGVLRAAGSFPSPQREPCTAPAPEQGRVERQGCTRLGSSGTAPQRAAHASCTDSPVSQPCPSSRPGTPWHWGIPSFPVETRRKGMALAQRWAGQAPCGALAGSAPEGSPVLGHHQESPDRDAQPCVAHRESCGAGQVRHPGCQTCRRFNVGGKVGCLFLRDKYSLPFSES